MVMASAMIRIKVWGISYRSNTGRQPTQGQGITMEGFLKVWMLNWVNTSEPFKAKGERMSHAVTAEHRDKETGRKAIKV